MRFLALLPFLLLPFALPVGATHNRAAEITYRHVGGNTYEVTVVTYTEYGGNTDRNSLEIFWGDGAMDTIPRIAIDDQSYPLIRQSTYRGTHTYAGFGIYKISIQDINRVNDIVNINLGGSQEIPIYVEDTLVIVDPAIWGTPNSSVVTTTKAVDTAYTNQVYYHTMGAYDPDGLDSLHFEFYTPLQDSGFPVPNYQTLPEAFPGTTLTIDPLTGLVTWDSPPALGIVNVGIIVREFRRRYNPDGSLKAVIEIGSVKRDLEIFIFEAENDPPVIAAINDTCVIAGTVLSIPIKVTDPDVGQTITVNGTGGPFLITESLATIEQTPPTGTGFWNGFFQWNTVCNHVEPGYYQVTLNAQDNYTGGPGSDVETLGIKVVAPPTENLTATPSGNSVILNWVNPYTCSGATRFIGFSVWRREGPNPFEIDTCTPGLVGQGYVKIASGLEEYLYVDNDVQIGRNYCYRVLAEFGATTSLGFILNFVESLPSNEACTQLKRDLPVITKVSVLTTDATNGTMRVEWTNPSIADFDTIQNPGPYRYELYRSQGFFASQTPLLVQTYTAPLFSQLLDTAFTDVGLNTLDSPYAYTVKFYSDTTEIGETDAASSVYLTVNPAGHQLELTWEEHVPWTNTSYVIFRSYPPGSPYVSIDTVESSPYLNTGLQNDSTYCYYVQSIGAYTDTTITAPLVNDSEQKCAVPIDTVGPCPPRLEVTNVCNDDGFALGDFTNLLKWTKPNTNCAGDAIKYYVYYAATTSETLTLIDSMHLINDTTLQHELSNTVAGCYAVAAIDSYYNVGPMSAIVCVDNCPLYALPNTFTPNNDGANDIFHPLLPFRFVEKVNMKIFTSWGSLVYETTDPNIGWDGINQTTGNEAGEGTYYFVCEVFEQRLENTGEANFVLDGFIHLYR